MCIKKFNEFSINEKISSDNYKDVGKRIKIRGTEFQKGVRVYFTHTMYKHNNQESGYVDVLYVMPDNTLVLPVKRYGGKVLEILSVYDDRIEYGGSPAFFHSYYTKQMSKFQDDVYDSKNLYDLIMKYKPDFKFPFINDTTIRNFGWDIKYHTNSIRGLTNLYDANILVGVQNDYVLLFDFNNYKISVYSGVGNEVKIFEDTVRIADDVGKISMDYIGDV